MTYRLFIGALLLFTQNVIAAEFPLTIIEPFDEAKIVIYVSESDIEKSPAWQPADGALPLTIEKLIAVINKYNAGKPKMLNAIVHEIELKPILHHEKQNRWYYLVQMKAAGEQAHRHYFAVLMNGKIISAIKKPETYK